MQALPQHVTNDAREDFPRTEGNELFAPDSDETKGDTGVGWALTRVLLVEEDQSVLSFHTRILDGYNVPVDQCRNGFDALERLSTTAYDLMITNLELPGLSGIDLLQWVRHHRPTTRAVVVCQDEKVENILAAMRAGARDYLVKPISLRQFREMLDRWNQPQRSANRQIFSSLMKQVMHDVRSEIVGLEVVIKLLKLGRYGKVDAGVDKVLGSMRDKIEQLQGLTSDYCRLAKILLQGGVIPTERIELKGEVIAQVLAESQAALERKEITVTNDADLSVDCDAYVMGNRVMLKSLFRTLFNNAVRHCPAAGAISYGITTNGRRYKVHVANEGDIVPVHLQAGIFEEFMQLKPGKDTLCQGEGLGLGLAMAKDIARQHGGDIWYESITNGSKFVCTLPSCQQSL